MCTTTLPARTATTRPPRAVSTLASTRPKHTAPFQHAHRPSSTNPTLPACSIASMHQHPSSMHLHASSTHPHACDDRLGRSGGEHGRRLLGTEGARSFVFGGLCHRLKGAVRPCLAVASVLRVEATTTHLPRRGRRGSMVWVWWARMARHGGRMVMVRLTTLSERTPPFQHTPPP